MTPESLFIDPVERRGNYIFRQSESGAVNQDQTNAVFSDKWEKVNLDEGKEEAYKFQLEWYLKLYGFGSEQALAGFLETKQVILDAGSGLGYKAAWFARLAPHALVIGMDYSESAELAAENFKDIPNLYFVRGDIADTRLRQGSVGFVSCDQVIMHTEDPDKTFDHLSSILSPAGEFACYVYAKKAIPRELLDDYFRKEVHGFTKEQLWEMSEQLTELGKRLSELHVSFEAPDIPLLGIKGGTYDVQRFLYWNFLKCFWNSRFSRHVNDATNFDWYSPSNARRFSEAEFREMISRNRLTIEHFHQEEACYSGRFKKNN